MNNLAFPMSTMLAALFMSARAGENVLNIGILISEPMRARGP